MTEKDHFLRSWEREFQITLKVLSAFPPDKLDLKPHERSRSARELAWSFVSEEKVIDGIIEGKVDFRGEAELPLTLEEILISYRKAHRDMVDRVKNLPEEDFHGAIKFPVGPGQIDDVRRADILWMLLMDSINHRGQLSVYLRMAGGKVPAIYGPSADEPWSFGVGGGE